MKCNSDSCSCNTSIAKLFAFYAIADRDDLEHAQWYCTYAVRRRTGFVKSLRDAKVWSNYSTAKAAATRLGAPARLVEFCTNNINLIDQTEHLKKLAEKKRRLKIKRQEEIRKYEIRCAEEALRRAQEDYQRLLLEDMTKFPKGSDT